MKIKKTVKYLGIIATCAFLITACKKKEDAKDSDTSAAADNALAESAYNDVHNIADEASGGSLSSYFPTNQSTEKEILSACATVTNDTTQSPHVLTINFGATNCTCADGRDRRGKIIVSYSGHYRDSASVHTITFDNYFVDNNQILGTKTVTNNGHNSQGHLTFTVVVQGQIVKPNNSGVISWNANHTREWIAGESTPTRFDDQYLITGSSSGTHASGETFSTLITTALQRNIGCHHFVSGVIQVTPSNKPVRIIDYGNGACDNQATVTINGNTYVITLH